VTGPGGYTENERGRVLARHVDHLLGQLHHQTSLIENAAREEARLREEIGRLEKLPEELAAAAARVQELREHVTGLKETEIELRRRVDELAAEDVRKERHITELDARVRRYERHPVHWFGRAFRALFSRRANQSDRREDGDASG